MPTLRMHQKLTGFTLIELVMVVAIIGILSAIAIPRFSNMVVQSQIAANQAFATALSEGTGIVHAAWIAAGAPASESSITIEGTSVSVDPQGFPDSTAGNWGVITNTNQCISIVSNVMPNPPQMFALTSSCTETPCYVVTSPGANCVFTMYSGATAISPTRTVTYNIGSGTVVVN